MKKFYLFLCIFMVLGISKAITCSCFSEIQISERFENSTAVFTAIIIESHTSSGSNPYSSYTMKVLQTWKGNVNDTISTTQGSSAACGVYYQTDSTYLIFADDNTYNYIYTNLCSINLLISDATELINWLNETTSVKNINKDSREITVFPNPSKGTVYIKSEKKLQSISIYDFSGRSIWKLADPDREIILPELDAGMYLLVFDRDGIRYSQKIHIL